MGLCCAVFETMSCACTLGKCVTTDGRLSVKYANIMYLFILIIFTFVAFLLQEWSGEFNFYSFNIGCQDIPGVDVSACKGENAVYRISIGLASWFIMVAFGSSCSQKIHSGFWGVKLISLLIITVGFFFIPIVGQNSYVQVARTVSGIFLVSQLVSFIDAAYHWNAFFVEKAFNNEMEVNKKWTSVILTICAMFMVGIIVCLSLFYLHYNYCIRQEVFITVTVILVVFSTVLQLQTQETNSSLLTSCFVSMYAVYLCWSSISSDECNPGQSSEAQLALACFVSSLSLAWTCYATGTKDWNTGTRLIEDTEEDTKEDTEGTQSMFIFHLIMATGSIYMSMLLTNWGTVSGQKSEAQMWVSIISQWISVSIYLWTIVASKCCPQRDF